MHERELTCEGCILLHILSIAIAQTSPVRFFQHVWMCVYIHIRIYIYIYIYLYIYILDSYACCTLQQECAKGRQRSLQVVGVGNIVCCFAWRSSFDEKSNSNSGNPASSSSSSTFHQKSKIMKTCVCFAFILLGLEEKKNRKGNLRRFSDGPGFGGPYGNPGPIFHDGKKRELK
jgi:hypothetical protein